MTSKQNQCSIYKGFNIVLNENEDNKTTSAVIDSTFYCLQDLKLSQLVASLRKRGSSDVHICRTINRQSSWTLYAIGGDILRLIRLPEL
jgi:hypothetical protein